METSISEPELTPQPATPGRSILCPGCGYDLRGSAGDRCSECGLSIDRAALDRSAFAWAHRATLGRLRAFLKTVWLVLADAQSLRHEAAKPQSPRDGASFRRCVAVVLSACFAVVPLIIIAGGGIQDLMIDQSEYMARGGMPSWSQDLLVPWSAGIAIAPAMFAYTTLFAFYVAGAPRSIFRTRGPEDYRQTVEAISGYVVAPLVILLPAMGGYAALFFLAEHFEWTEGGPCCPSWPSQALSSCSPR